MISTAQFALDSAVKVLEYYETFFGVQYPLPKQGNITKLAHAIDFFQMQKLKILLEKV